MEYWWLEVGFGCSIIFLQFSLRRLKVHGLLHFRCQHHQQYQYQEISCLLHRNTFSWVYMNAATPTATISAATWQQLYLSKIDMFCAWIWSAHAAANEYGRSICTTCWLWNTGVAKYCRLMDTIDWSSYQPSHRLAYLAIDSTILFNKDSSLRQSFLLIIIIIIYF